MSAPHVRYYGKGPPLLLIHGLGSSGDDWAFQIGPLAAAYALIVPDLSGCGRSPAGTGSPSIAGWAAELWALVDTLGLPSLRIAGFSMGGAVALEMALQRPQAVSHLVTINSLPSYRVDHWRKWLELHVQMTLVRWIGMRRMAGLVARRLFPHPHQQPMRQRVIDVVGEADAAPYLRCARALADWCAAERCRDFAVPMLMLAGEYDYTPLAEKRDWAARLNAALTVVRGSRHGTPFDAIAATNRCLRDFCAGLAVPGELQADSAETAPRAAPTLPDARLTLDAC